MPGREARGGEAVPLVALADKARGILRQTARQNAVVVIGRRGAQIVAHRGDERRGVGGAARGPILPARAGGDVDDAAELLLCIHAHGLLLR